MSRTTRESLDPSVQDAYGTTNYEILAAAEMLWSG